MKAGLTLLLLTVGALGVLSLIPLLGTYSAAESGWNPKQVKLVGSVVASAVLGAAALAMLFRKPDASHEKNREWAF